MSKVKIQGNTSGTGIFTVAAPATNTDRTITLPDVDATVLTTAGGTITGTGNDLFKVTSGSQTLYVGGDSNGMSIAGGAGQTGPGIYLYNTQGSVNLYTNNTLRLKVDSNGYMTNPYQPCFSAYGNSGNVAIGNGAALVLTQTQRNVSSSYNTSNGRFTAPVSGFYHFSYGAYAYSGAQFAFKINGTDWTPSDSIGLITIGTNELGSGSIDVYLSAGDYAQFGLRSGYAINVYTSHSWFSGYLVG